MSDNNTQLEAVDFLQLAKDRVKAAILISLPDAQLQKLVDAELAALIEPIRAGYGDRDSYMYKLVKDTLKDTFDTEFKAQVQQAVKDYVLSFLDENKQLVLSDAIVEMAANASQLHWRNMIASAFASLGMQASVYVQNR